MERTKRETRTYRHRVCGGRTTVSGMALVYVTHIFDHPDRTYCEDCDDSFPMHEFVWDDTEESLTDYYSRYTGMFKGMDRFFGSNSVAFMLIAVGAVVGGTTGLIVGRIWGTLLTVLASIVGVVVVGFVGFVVGFAIIHRVRQRILGTDELTSLD